MSSQRYVYVTIDWQEHNIMDNTHRRQVWDQERIVSAPNDYPETLPCCNPTCVDGGFEIGSRIRALLDSGRDSEQNSLICRNAIHPDRNKRCLHTIIYTIACIRPYQRERAQVVVSESSNAV